MCPWENREQMPTQGVIPSWPEADDHLSRWLQEHAHHAQDSSGVCEMLEAVDGNYNVCKLLRRRCEPTGILNTCSERLLSRCLQKVLTNINTDNPLGSSLSHFNGLNPFATAEVDDGFPWDLAEEFIPE